MLVGFVLLGCRSSNYMDESHLDSISNFQSAIRDKQFETAYALLSTEVQAKISNDEFTAALSKSVFEKSSVTSGRRFHALKNRL